MTRRRVLPWLGLATVAAFGVLAVLDLRMQDAGDAGIVDYELAGSAADARQILTAWGERGRDAARLSLWFDFVFIAFYAPLLALLLDAVRGDWPRWIAGLPVLGALCDVVENYELLLFLGGYGSDSAASLATGFALAKFALLAATIVVLIVAAVRRRHSRGQTP